MILKNADVLILYETLERLMDNKELNSKVEELMNVENEVEIIQVPIEMLEKSEMSFEDIVGLTYMIQPFDSSEVVMPEKMDVINS